MVGDSISDDHGLLFFYSIFSFYKDLYANKSSFISQDQISNVVCIYIRHIVSQPDNDLLTKMPNYMEIKSAFFALNMDSALGPYGFVRSFYHTCWDNIFVDH